MWWLFCLIMFIIIILKDKGPSSNNDVFIPFEDQCQNGRIDQPHDNGDGF